MNCFTWIRCAIVAAGSLLLPDPSLDMNYTRDVFKSAISWVSGKGGRLNVCKQWKGTADGTTEELRTREECAAEEDIAEGTTEGTTEELQTMEEECTDEGTTKEPVQGTTKELRMREGQARGNIEWNRIIMEMGVE